jgi:hypothetical protein
MCDIDLNQMSYELRLQQTASRFTGLIMSATVSVSGWLSDIIQGIFSE